MSQPALPYAGTSGFAEGSPTSEARARSEDADGTTASRQDTILAYLMGRGRAGVTSPELEQRYGWHHGQASAALSNLHKDHKIARLADTRERCCIYVLPDQVHNRTTEPHGSWGKFDVLPEIRQQVEQWKGGGDSSAASMLKIARMLNMI